MELRSARGRVGVSILVFVVVGKVVIKSELRFEV